MKTESEKAFEEYCLARNYQLERIFESQRKSEKRPDYYVRIKGVRIGCEIKEIQKLGSPNFGVQLGKSIETAKKQLRFFSGEKIPTLLVTMDFSGHYLLEREHVEAAMFGATQHWVGVSREVPSIRSFRRDRKFSESNKTYISALAVLEHRYSTGFKMKVYQNPYADNELDCLMFSEPDEVLSIIKK